MNRRMFGIIGTVVSLILIGTTLNLALDPLIDYDGTYYNISNSSQVLGVNALAGTLLGSVLVIMFVLSLVLMFIPNKE